jgi:hypothetical protein
MGGEGDGIILHWLSDKQRGEREGVFLKGSVF